jgi:hypothetical protein
MQAFTNNNVGNIRFVPSIKWQGQVGNKNGFAVFDTVSNGVRAMVKQLNTYKSRGLNTIQEIITTYAPPNENDTTEYIATVSKITKIPATKILTPEDYKAVITAMIKVEKGYYPDVSTKPLIDKFVNEIIASAESAKDTGLTIGVVAALAALAYFVLK